MSEFSEGFYPVDFTNRADELRDNQRNITYQSKSVTDFSNPKIGLKEMKIRSPDKLFLGHININSTKNQFDSLVYMLDKNGDICLISETKLNDPFPSTQFKIETFTTPYWYDRNDKGGDLLSYIRENISSSLLQCKSQGNIESLSVEINLRKMKVVFKLLVQSS